ncbi:ATP-binding protein [Streptomyces triticirhizae]|uniref:ATP-binding protein n=1 Tax=Streptomyces triticirhizae TaxID=2483353 RepID=A0A3M2MB82_9ACTN|nr:ATP-binding protein [Streptomyces triticirhizae]RMI44438.1 ATP-binding protein [Streptomyces triticirhizae]
MTVTASARPTGHPGYSETLPCEEASISAARRLVRTALLAWGLDELAEDSSVIVSELATNTVRHTGCRHMRVTISRPTPDWVRVAVVDKSRTMPDPRTASGTDTDGRGLIVVEALSDRWGTDLLRWGKRVWAELRTDVKP